jgi:hypothetical protein
MGNTYGYPITAMDGYRNSRGIRRTDDTATISISNTVKTKEIESRIAMDFLNCSECKKLRDTYFLDMKPHISIWKWIKRKMLEHRCPKHINDPE